MARPKKPEGERAVSINLPERIVAMIDDTVEGELIEMLDRGVLPKEGSNRHFIAARRRQLLSEMVEDQYGPDGRYPVEVTLRVPISVSLGEAERREVDEWARRTAEMLNESLPSAVKASIEANKIRRAAAD